ncbi:hypothetical protein SUGI_0343040 [Cryptomeria japonica]|nr:hypothetical protein SUGI_0343040 [Cryptomeria japonica]
MERNQSALFSRSFSGRHLSFRSNLNLGNVRSRRISTKSFSFSHIFEHRGCSDDFNESECNSCQDEFNECEWNSCQGCSNCGSLDYALERLQKRQMFLRSYQLSRKKKLSQKLKASFLKLKEELWSGVAWNCSFCCSHGYERLKKINKRSRFCIPC